MKATEFTYMKEDSSGQATKWKNWDKRKGYSFHSTLNRHVNSANNKKQLKKKVILKNFTLTKYLLVFKGMLICEK